jgi:hypothetical protein
MIQLRRMRSMSCQTGGIGNCFVVSVYSYSHLVSSQVFPSFLVREHAVSKDSALGRLRERRAQKQAREGGSA